MEEVQTQVVFIKSCILQQSKQNALPSAPPKHRRVVRESGLINELSNLAPSTLPSPTSSCSHDPLALAQGIVGCRIFTFSETGKNGCVSSRSAWSLGDQLVPFAGNPSEGLCCSPAA